MGENLSTRLIWATLTLPSFWNGTSVCQPCWIGPADLVEIDHIHRSRRRLASSSRRTEAALRLCPISCWSFHTRLHLLRRYPAALSALAELKIGSFS